MPGFITQHPQQAPLLWSAAAKSSGLAPGRLSSQPERIGMPHICNKS